MQDNKSTLHRLIIAVVALIGLAVSIVCLVWRLNKNLSVHSFVLVGIYYAFVFYYGTVGYKKPHGKLVRYLMMILAVYVAYSTTIMVERWDIGGIILTSGTIAAVFIGYIAGRLNKFKKNIFWAVVVTGLLLVKSFWPINVNLNVYTLFVLDRTMPLFMWATVMFIYFFRYREHKTAGITADSEEE